MNSYNLSTISATKLLKRCATTQKQKRCLTCMCVENHTTNQYGCVVMLGAEREESQPRERKVLNPRSIRTALVEK